jgi:mRNA interferase MazF
LIELSNSFNLFPITTNVKKDVSILRVNLKRGEGGVKKSSSIMIDQLRSIDNKRFIKRTGILPKNLQLDVVKNIGIILELSTD